jgi:aldose 1-epimerase
VLWGDESFTYVQVFTSRKLATRPAGAAALAVEPMTAPANALNTGRGLRWLEPGETWKAEWGIRHEGFGAA